MSNLHFTVRVPPPFPDAQVSGGASTPEVSLDERKQKHVSFDASSLMRSQTLATMDEGAFQRALAAQQQQQPGGGGVLLPSHSSERLVRIRFSIAPNAVAFDEHGFVLYL